MKEERGHRRWKGEQLTPGTSGRRPPRCSGRSPQSACNSCQSPPAPLLAAPAEGDPRRRVGPGTPGAPRGAPAPTPDGFSRRSPCTAAVSGPPPPDACLCRHFPRPCPRLCPRSAAVGPAVATVCPVVSAAWLVPRLHKEGNLIQQIGLVHLGRKADIWQGVVLNS